jgi:hypothetical protein
MGGKNPEFPPGTAHNFDQLKGPNQMPTTHSVTINIESPQKVSLFKEVTNRFVEKNWWLIVAYAALCIGGAYVSVPSLGW